MSYGTKDDATVLQTSGLSAAEIARRLEATQISRFYTKGGTGFAAEDANALNDRIRLKDVEITGTNHKADGADRIVNGISIQSKYFATSEQTVSSAFDGKTGLYRYRGQLLEVPHDQYDDALNLMREKIKNGKLPGVNDPNEAGRIVKQGSITYKQARNIARAGSIDSLLYDAKTQAATSAYMFGVAFAVDFAKRKWGGEKTNDAIKGSIGSAIAAAVSSGITGLITAQLLRTRMAAVGKVMIRNGVKTMSSTSVGRECVQKFASGSLGKAVSGGAAINHVSKILRTNFITSVVTTAVITGPDFYRAAISKNISWAQLTKNLVVNATGVVSGTAGWMAGAAAGGALGSVIPIVGTAAGAFVGGLFGGLAGGTAGSYGAKYLMDQFIEDDAKHMVDLVKMVAEEVALEYLLSENEMAEFVAVLKQMLTPAWLKTMFATGARDSDDFTHKAFAREAFDQGCQNIVSKRPCVRLPAPNVVQRQIDEIIGEANISPPLRKIKYCSGSARTVQKLDRCLSRYFSVIEVEHPAESLPPTHNSVISEDTQGRLNQSIAQPALSKCSIEASHANSW